MVETITEALVDLELRPEDCHADAFYTEAEKAALESSSYTAARALGPGLVPAAGRGD